MVRRFVISVNILFGTNKIIKAIFIDLNEYFVNNMFTTLFTLKRSCTEKSFHY